MTSPLSKDLINDFCQSEDFEFLQQQLDRDVPSSAVTLRDVLEAADDAESLTIGDIMYITLQKDNKDVISEELRHTYLEKIKEALRRWLEARKTR